MRRSHSPQRGLSAVACGGSGPLKLLLAVVGAATDRTPAGCEGATGAGATTDVIFPIGSIQIQDNNITVPIGNISCLVTK